MKKFTFYYFLLSTTISALFSAYSAGDPSLEQFSPLGSPNSKLPEAKQEWPRVKAYFERERFLKGYNKEYGKTLGQIIPDQDNLSDSCWKALFSLKEYYKTQEDLGNYGFAYLNMAKLLLSYQQYPPSHEEGGKWAKKKFLCDLCATIED